MILAPNATTATVKNSAGWFIGGQSTTVTSEGEWHFYYHGRHYRGTQTQHGAKKYMSVVGVDATSIPTDTDEFTFAMRELNPTTGVWGEEQTVTNDGSLIVFPVVAFPDEKDAGDHYFLLYEVPGDDTGIVYDASWYIVKTTVTDKDPSEDNYNALATNTYYKVVTPPAEMRALVQGDATNGYAVKADYLATALTNGLDDVVFVNNTKPSGTAILGVTKEVAFTSGSSANDMNAEDKAATYTFTLAKYRGSDHDSDVLPNPAHGATLAVIMPTWMKYVLHTDVRRFAQLAERVMGVKPQENEERTALAGIDAFRAFLTGIGLPEKLSELGVRESDIPLLARKCHSTGNGFRKLNEEDIAAIYRMAL